MHAMRVLFGAATAIALLTAAPVRAAAPEGESAAPADDARALYERGRVAFDTADYDGAVKWWTEAYAALPDTHETKMVRNDIVYNISSAESRAYKIDGDIRRLKRAQLLLQQYLNDFVTKDEESLDEYVEEYDRVKERVAELDAQIAAVEGDGSDDTPQTDLSGPTSKPDKPKMGKLTLTGVILMPLGVLGIGLTAGGAIMATNARETYENVPELRDAATRQSQTGIALAATGGVLTLALVGAGAALYVVGRKRDRAKRQQSALAWPSIGWGSIGVAGRF